VVCRTGRPYGQRLMFHPPERQMHLNDPKVYMRLRGNPRTIVLECAVCPTRFQAKDGVAFPAIRKDGKAIMAVFGCHRCYLEAMPTECLWSVREAKTRRGALHLLWRRPTSSPGTTQYINTSSRPSMSASVSTGTVSPPPGAPAGTCECNGWPKAAPHRVWRRLRREREELERDRHAARDDFANIEFVALVGATPDHCVAARSLG
jgi:hypothetical protein